MAKNSNRLKSQRKMKKIEPTPEFRPEQIRIVAGLGNPGLAYRNTYHNVGFLALDYFSGETPENEWHKSKNFSYLKTGKLILVKPGIFMNESGEALKQALRYFKAKPENLLVVHDDSDIELGKYKIGFSRGAAGHRGVASVINNLKTNNFWRLRIGVRNRRGKAGDFVLEKIKHPEEKILASVLQHLRKILDISDSN
ncbi:aminoacyl-tRNA hydrolase [bacterium]|nr:MAG: aminoacyl-tRNA hydrolase [bacterium]